MTNESEAKPKNSSVLEKSKPKTAKTILLILLSILFVISTLLTLISYDVWRVLFNPPLIKSILVDEFIQSDLVPRVLEDLSAQRALQRVERGESLSGVDEPDIQLLVSFVDFEAWTEIKNLIISNEFITHLVSVSVDGIYEWLDAPDPLPTFVWEMTPIKDRLVGEEGEEAIMTAYRTMPECTPEEIDDFQSRLAAMPPNVEVLYNLCQFPDPWQEDQVDDYINALIDVNQNVPAAYDFNQMLESNMAAGNVPHLAKTTVRILRILGQWGWIVSVALIILIAVIGVRSLNSAGKWLGIPILISGALPIVLHFLVRNQFFELVMGRFTTQMSPLLRTEISNSINRLTGHFLQPLLIEGVVLLGVGLILLVIGLLAKQKK